MSNYSKALKLAVWLANQQIPPNYQGEVIEELRNLYYKNESLYDCFEYSKETLEVLEKTLDFLGFVYRDVSMNEYAEEKRKELEETVLKVVNKIKDVQND